mgnify:CR=1 FL=1
MAKYTEIDGYIKHGLISQYKNRTMGLIFLSKTDAKLQKKKTFKQELGDKSWRDHLRRQQLSLYLIRFPIQSFSRRTLFAQLSLESGYIKQEHSD